MKMNSKIISKNPFVVEHECFICHKVYIDKENITGGLCDKCQDKIGVE